MPIQVSAISVSATPYDNSGILAASGDASAAYPGPWRVETQQLKIEYQRVPYAQGSYAMTGNVTGLSGTFTASADVDGTYLLYKVTAERKVQKTYDIYDTSTYVQNQRFKIIASDEDVYGNTYGDLSAGVDVNGNIGSQFALGPQGVIITEEPYYNRRLWDDSLDSVVTSGFEGTSKAFYTFNADPVQLDFSAFQPFSNYLDNFNYTFVPNSLSRLSFKEAGDGDMREWGVPNVYILPSYTTAKENDALTIDFINQVAQTLATPWHSDWTVAGYPTTLSKFWRPYPQTGAQVGTGAQTEYAPTCLTPALTSYDYLRHDFS